MTAIRIEEAAVCGGFKMEELEEADEMKANRFLFKVPAAQSVYRLWKADE